MTNEKYQELMTEAVEILRQLKTKPPNADELRMRLLCIKILINSY